MSFRVVLAAVSPRGHFAGGFGGQQTRILSASQNLEKQKKNEAVLRLFCNNKSKIDNLVADYYFNNPD